MVTPSFYLAVMFNHPPTNMLNVQLKPRGATELYDHKGGGTTAESNPQGALQIDPCFPNPQNPDKLSCEKGGQFEDSFQTDSRFN